MSSASSATSTERSAALAWAQAAPALRLALAPVLMLAGEFAADTPLPFMGPVLAVILLMASPVRPPLMVLVKLFVVVVGIAFGIAWIGAVTADSPFSFWLGLLALFTVCFIRLARQPQDLVATVAVFVAAVVAVLLQVSAQLPPVLPGLMARAFLLAALVTLIAHALLPGLPGAPRPLPSPSPPSRGEGLRAIVKGLALLVALAACILLGDTSAILISVTVTNVLRMPDRGAGLTFGQAAVLGNLLAVAAVTPVLILLAWRPDQEATALTVALVGALSVATGFDRGGRWAALTPIAMPVVVVLLGLYAPIAGEGVTAKILERLFFMALAIAYGVTVHSLLAPLVKSHDR